MAFRRHEWQFGLAGLLGTITALCVLFALTGKYGAFLLMALAFWTVFFFMMVGGITAIRRCLEAFWDWAGIIVYSCVECRINNRLVLFLFKIESEKDSPASDDETLARIADDLFLVYDREEAAAKSPI